MDTSVDKSTSQLPVDPELTNFQSMHESVDTQTDYQLTVDDQVLTKCQPCIDRVVNQVSLKMAIKNIDMPLSGLVYMTQEIS